MSKKISSSTPSGTSSGQTRKSTEKSGSKKSGGTKEGEKSGTTKESKKSEDIKSSLKPEKECPPDSLNISPDAVEGKKGPEKEIESSDFYEKLDEVREGVINEPEVKTPSIEKGEVDFDELKEILNKREDTGEKADIKSLFAGTDKEIEIGSKAFKKLEGAGRRKEDDSELNRDYEKPVESREDVHSLWDYTGVGARSRRDDLDGDAGGRKHDKEKPVADRGPEQFKAKDGREKSGASSEGKGEAGVKDESKLKASAEGKGEAGVGEKGSEQSRIYKETHKTMEKLHGQDKSEEKIKNKDKSESHRTYETTQKQTEDGTELKFKEDHTTAYKDKDCVKYDESSAVTTRNPDGTYTKSYERTDSHGNKSKTELTTKHDGSSERKSQSTMKDGTKVNSTETTDKDGNHKTVSDETRPDGTKVHTEKTVDVDGKGKIITEETGPDGSVVRKEEAVDPESKEGKGASTGETGKGRSKEEDDKRGDKKTGDGRKIEDTKGRDKKAEDKKTGADKKTEEGRGRDKKVDTTKPPEIQNKENLTETDKFIIDKLGLEKMKPGDEISVSAEMLAEIGVGEKIGVEGADLSAFLNSQGQFTLTRDKDNPNKYILTGGSGLMGGIKAEEGAVIESAGGQGGVEGGVSISLEMDFSKKGEAQNTASYLARCMNPAIDVIDAVTDDRLPGDSSLKFFSDHFKSIEVQGGISKELSASIGEGLGLDGSITDKLMAGGKLERQKDDKTGKTTSWDLTASVGENVSLNADTFVGIDSIAELKAKTTAMELHGGLSLEETTHFPVNEEGKIDMEKVNSELNLNLNIGGEANSQVLSSIGMGSNEDNNRLKTRGFNLEASASINDIIAMLPEKDREALQEAFKNKDYERIQQICQEALPGIKFEGSLNTFERTNVSGEAGIDFKYGVGVGVDIGAGGEYVSSLSDYEGSITLDTEGLQIEGTHYEKGVKQEGAAEPYKITWGQVGEDVEEIYPDSQEIMA